MSAAEAPVAGHAAATKVGGVRVAAPHKPETALTKTDDGATAKTQVEKALSTAAVGPVGAGKAGALIEAEVALTPAVHDGTTKATPSTFTPPEPKHTKQAGSRKGAKQASVGKVPIIQPGNHSGKNTAM